MNRSSTSLFAALPLILSCALLAACGVEAGVDDELGVAKSALTTVSGFGSNPGSLNMYSYVPASMPAKAPLVVAMHGCTMSASDYVNAGWNGLADAWKFYVVYPEQPSSMKCFDWYDLAQNQRDQGQALSIKQMVDYMRAHYGIDPNRIYVTGLSAGGAMTATMLATYPDVFAAGAPMSGLPYRCADTESDTGTCMGSGKQQSAQTWGDLVRGAYSGYQGPYPRVSIWQGASDYTVSTDNSTELMKQWTDVNGIDATADASGQVETAAHTEYKNSAGETLVETWLVSNMGHGTAIEPGFQPANGCGQAGNFVLSAGICSTYYTARFFGLDPSPSGDAGTTEPPAASDAGVPTNPSGPDAAVASTSDAGAAATACAEWNDNNYDQVQAGRAQRCGDYQLYACAIGSNDNLGYWSLGIVTWVREVRPGYFEAGRCADASPVDAGVVSTGPDASSTTSPADAGTSPGPDASSTTAQSANSPGPGANTCAPATSADAGMSTHTDGFGCSSSGAAMPSLASLLLLVALRRRRAPSMNN